MKVSENTKVSTDLKTILSIVVGVAVGVWAYFGIEERLNKLATAEASVVSISGNGTITSPL